jgi:hypothetical protein
MKRTELINIFPKGNAFQYYKGRNHPVHIEVLERYDVLVFRNNKKLTPEVVDRLKQRWAHKIIEIQDV